MSYFWNVYQLFSNLKDLWNILKLDSTIAVRDCYNLYWLKVSLQDFESNPNQYLNDKQHISLYKLYTSVNRLPSPLIKGTVNLNVGTSEVLIQFSFLILVYMAFFLNVYVLYFSSSFVYWTKYMLISYSPLKGIKVNIRWKPCP